MFFLTWPGLTSTVPQTDKKKKGGGEVDVRMKE
jgi:hypothetical protein